jgi:hypothetical protein
MDNKDKIIRARIRELTLGDSDSKAENKVTRSEPSTGATRFSYYNFDKIYSMNARYNFIVGARGVGKSYGKKVKVIRAGIDKGHEFIYLRRYKEELKSAKTAFFADIGAGFEDYDFRVEKHYAQYSHIKFRDEKKRPWITIGYFFALSQGQSFKSTPFPKVRHIVYDEFIIEKGMVQYLPNEAEVFTNFFSTVDRSQDKTRAWFLANSVSITNPYFIKYGIEPKEDEEWIKKFPLKNGNHFLACHFPNSETFRSEVAETEFGQFILASDPDYEEYAAGNKFKDNHKNLLGKKLPNAGYVFSLETKSGTFSVWRDWAENKWYIQEGRPKQELMYTLLPDKMASGKTLLFYSDKQLQLLRAGFKSDKVLFDKAKTRQAFIQIFTR